MYCCAQPPTLAQANLLMQVCVVWCECKGAKHRLSTWHAFSTSPVGGTACLTSSPAPSKLLPTLSLHRVVRLVPGQPACALRWWLPVCAGSVALPSEEYGRAEASRVCVSEAPGHKHPCLAAPLPQPVSCPSVPRTSCIESHCVIRATVLSVGLAVHWSRTAMFCVTK
jgi:hypothetical protein